MESRSNTERLAIRFAPYIQELRDFFKSRGLRFGSPDDLVPLAEALASSSSFHDEMMSMIRSVIFRERGVVPRNELLELILVASGGAAIDQAAQHVVAPVGALYEFVAEVLHSLKKRSFVEEDDVEAEEVPASAGQSPLHSAQQTLGSSAGPREGVNFAVEAGWNFDAPPNRPAESHPLAGAFARAQTISPHFKAPEAGRVAPLPPMPRILEASSLAVLPRAPLPPPPRHFFRNTMCVLLFTLAAALVWRHMSPVPLPGATSAGQTVATAGQTMATAAADSGIPGSLVAPGPNAPQPGTASAGPSASFSPRPDQAQPDAAPRPQDQARGQAGNPPAAGAQAATPPPAPPVNPNQNPNPGPKSGASATHLPPPPSARRRSPRSSPPGTSPPAAAPPPNTSTKQGAFLVSSGVMDDNLIASPAPRYPKWASMAGVEGQVILQAVVSRNGTVVATHVLEGHRLLRGAATHAVKSWRYRPYVVKGKPTDVATIVIVDFHLPH